MSDELWREPMARMERWKAARRRLDALDPTSLRTIVYILSWTATEAVEHELDEQEAFLRSVELSGDPELPPYAHLANLGDSGSHPAADDIDPPAPPKDLVAGQHHGAGHAVGPAAQSHDER